MALENLTDNERPLSNEPERVFQDILPTDVDKTLIGIYDFEILGQRNQIPAVLVDLPGKNEPQVIPIKNRPRTNIPATAAPVFRPYRDSQQAGFAIATYRLSGSAFVPSLGEDQVMYNTPQTITFSDGTDVTAEVIYLHQEHTIDKKGILFIPRADIGNGKRVYVVKKTDGSWVPAAPRVNDHTYVLEPSNIKLEDLTSESEAQRVSSTPETNNPQPEMSEPETSPEIELPSPTPGPVTIAPSAAPSGRGLSRWSKIGYGTAAISAAALTLIGAVEAMRAKSDNASDNKTDASVVESASVPFASAAPAVSAAPTVSASAVSSSAPASSAIPMALAAPTGDASLAPAPAAFVEANQPPVSISVMPRFLASRSEISSWNDPTLNSIETNTFKAEVNIALGNQIRAPFGRLAYKDPVLTEKLNSLQHKVEVGAYAYYGALFNDAETVRKVLSDSTHPHHKLLRRLIHPKNMGPWKDWDRKVIHEGSVEKKLDGKERGYLTGENWTVHDAKEYFEKVYLKSFRDFGWIDKESENVYTVEGGKALQMYRVLTDANDKEVREYAPYLMDLAAAVNHSLPFAQAKTTFNDGLNNFQPGRLNNQNFIPGPSKPTLESVPTNTIAPGDLLKNILKGVAPDSNITPAEPTFIKGSENEYHIDVSEHSYDAAVAHSSAPAVEVKTVNPQTRLQELLKVRSSFQRTNTLLTSGEIAVKADGSIFAAISACIGMENPDIYEEKITEFLRQHVKMSGLENYDADENGNVYAKLSDDQLKKLRAFVGRNTEGSGELIGLEDIKKACDVPSIRNCVNAAAANTTKSALRMAA